MTTQRKWRFFVLIGAGLIAAGALVYFSNGHVSTSKTQGAIGQRDVYRDGKVASADVAQPGSAPVATEAILKSSEFKALAKNPAFQELMRTDSFNVLAGNASFLVLLSNEGFRKLVQDARFATIIRNASFQTAVKNRQDLSPALRMELRIDELADRQAFYALLDNGAFRGLVQKHALSELISAASFKAVLADHTFALLAARQDFRAALQEGTAARMVSEIGASKR